MADPSGVLRGVHTQSVSRCAENEHPAPAGATRCYHGAVFEPLTTFWRLAHDHRRAGHPAPVDPQDAGPSVPVRPGAGRSTGARACGSGPSRARSCSTASRASRWSTWATAGARSRRPIAEQTVRLAYYPTTRQFSNRPAAELAAKLAPDHPRRPALHDVRGERLGGQRALDADRAAVLAGGGQVEQAQGDLPAGRLPRRHHGHLRGLRTAAPGPGLPAARGAGLREGRAAPSLPGPAGW